MLNETEHYVNHIFYSVLRHRKVPHMCAYTHTQKKSYSQSLMFSRLETVSSLSSSLFCLFLCASDSLLDIAFVSYLYSQLCTFLHRASPRQEQSFSKRSIRPLPLTKPAPSNTGTRKGK